MFFKTFFCIEWQIRALVRYFGKERCIFLFIYINHFIEDCEISDAEGFVIVSKKKSFKGRKLIEVDASCSSQPVDVDTCLK